MAEGHGTGGPAVTTTVPRIECSRLQLGRELGKGAQGRVIAVNGILINHRWRAALKRYEPHIAPLVDVTALEEITTFPGTLDPDDKLWLYENTAWPAVVAVDNGRVCGFLMRTVPAGYYFDFPTPTQGTVRKLATMDFLLNTDHYTTNVAGLPVTDKQRVALLQNLAVIVSRLHGLGVVVGDFSPKNLLFQLTPSPGCFLIDCDAMRVRGASVLAQVHTPDWEVPPGEPTATPEADAYKFALLAVRLFARDQSSRDPAALAQLSPALGNLAANSLYLDPSRRPSIADWKPALAEAYDTLDQEREPQRLYRSPSRRWPAPVRAFGIVLALAAAIVAIILLALNIGSHPSPAALSTTSPPATASSATSSPHTSASASGQAKSAQATQINYLLGASAATKRPLATALQDVRNCNDVSSAITTIRAVAQRYGTEYGMATRLSTGQLPNGAALKNDLIDAYYRSAVADYYFVEWAQYRQAAGCGSSTSATAAYNAGRATRAKAITAKDAFVRLWNPAAKSEGLPSRSGNDI
jgi:eukaryotic-like serine/threonine-protein kinase